MRQPVRFAPWVQWTPTNASETKNYGYRIWTQTKSENSLVKKLSIRSAQSHSNLPQRLVSEASDAARNLSKGCVMHEYHRHIIHQVLLFLLKGTSSIGSNACKNIKISDLKIIKLNELCSLIAVSLNSSSRRPRMHVNPLKTFNNMLTIRRDSEYDESFAQESRSPRLPRR